MNFNALEYVMRMNMNRNRIGMEKMTKHIISKLKDYYYTDYDIEWLNACSNNHEGNTYTPKSVSESIRKTIDQFVQEGRKTQIHCDPFELAIDANLYLPLE